MNFRFTIIGVTETRICDRECSFNFVPELPGYCFESVPTPLSAGGVGLFIDQNCKYRVLERVSNSCYQALSEAYNPEAYNFVAMLGFFREPIKIYFLIWNY